MCVECLWPKQCTKFSSWLFWEWRSGYRIFGLSIDERHSFGCAHLRALDSGEIMRLMDTGETWRSIAKAQKHKALENKCHER